MNKTRIERLEQRQGDAPPELVAILKRLKAEQGGTTRTAPNLADTLAGIITHLHDRGLPHHES